jgi:mono/diheme cytochrome c family protein
VDFARQVTFVPIMHKLLLIFGLALALTACNTNTTNPGGHSLEETQAKQRENEQKRAAEASQPKPAQPANLNLNGGELYAQNCAICHKDGANGAPPLAGIMNRRELPSGSPATDASLRNTIKMGRANMPAFSNVLTDEQINAIVAYVRTL